MVATQKEEDSKICFTWIAHKIVTRLVWVHISLTIYSGWLCTNCLLPHTLPCQCDGHGLLYKYICGELLVFPRVFVQYWIFHVSGRDAVVEEKNVLKIYVCNKVSNIWKKPSVIVENKITPWTKELRVGKK